MSPFTNTPRLLKGALVAVALPMPLPLVIAFQYNPATLTRTLQPRTGGQDQGRVDVPRLRGAPTESISLEIELDATDALVAGDPDAQAMGLHPQLAALEGLLYPPSPLVLANNVALATGIIEIVPPPAPLVLFIFGPRRIVPVRVTELRVTEETHDAELNPLQARVSLGLQVLSYEDLPPLHPGSAVFLAHQVANEVMGSLAVVNTLNAVTGGSTRIL